MKRVIENVAIGICCAIIFCFMLTGTYVFAKNPAKIAKKSYHITKEENEDFKEIDLELKTKLAKKVETSQNSFEYEFQIKDGNVILVNLNNGFKESVYSKGNAKYLAVVDYYFYDSAYTLIITDDGNIYANIYTNNSSNVKFKKIKTNNKVSGLKVLEREQRFYEYPSVELYGVSPNGDWERIKL